MGGGMNKWTVVWNLETPQKVLNIKAFKPISAANPLPSGMAKGSTGCPESILDQAANQRQKQREEVGFLFLLFFS